ncbi:hypothetical protein GIB67_032477, partial [Kingdonia uniflora]
WELGNTPLREVFLGWVWYKLGLDIFKFHSLFLSSGPRVSYEMLWISCSSKPRHSTGVWVSLWHMYFDFVGIHNFLPRILRESKK